jgi:hypothetical protein
MGQARKVLAKGLGWGKGRVGSDTRGKDSVHVGTRVPSSGVERRSLEAVRGLGQALNYG